MSRITPVLMLAVLFVAGGVCSAEDGWKKLTDGKTFKGWKINESKDSWKLEDGTFVAKGPRSHLFYVGDDKPFVNFELKVEVKTTPGSNGGIYFHTKWQETGWPKHGYEAQVNNTHKDRRKTGSLYAVSDVLDDAPAKDNEWFTEHIIVKGKHIVIKIDGKTVVDYTEPANKPAQGDKFERRLDSGTFALQAHDPKSVVYFRNIRAKRLP